MFVMRASQRQVLAHGQKIDWHCFVRSRWQWFGLARSYFDQELSSYIVYQQQSRVSCVAHVVESLQMGQF